MAIILWWWVSAYHRSFTNNHQKPIIQTCQVFFRLIKNSKYRMHFSLRSTVIRTRPAAINSMYAQCVTLWKRHHTPENCASVVKLRGPLRLPTAGRVPSRTVTWGGDRAHIEVEGMRYEEGECIYEWIASMRATSVSHLSWSITVSSEAGISEGAGSSVRHSPPFCVRSCQKSFSAIVTTFLQLSLI